MKEQASPLHGAALAVPVLLILGCCYLGSGLDATEQIYLDRAGARFADLAAPLYAPLYLLLLKGWSAWFDNPFWLRFPNLIGAVLALLLSNRVVRQSGGTHAAPGALLLLAGAPFLIEQVQTLSPAVLGLVIATAALACFVDYVRTGKQTWLVVWMVSTLLSWGVHAGLAYLVPIKWLYMVAYPDRSRSRRLSWWLAQIPIAGCFLVIFGADLGAHLLRLADSGWGGALRDFSALASGVPRPAGLVGAGLFALLLAGGIWASRDWRRDTRHGLLLSGFLVSATLYLSPLGHPTLGLVALPFMCTLASMGIRLFPRWGRQLLWTTIALTYLYGYWYIFA